MAQMVAMVDYVRELTAKKFLGMMNMICLSICFSCEMCVSKRDTVAFFIKKQV